VVNGSGFFQRVDDPLLPANTTHHRTVVSQCLIGWGCEGVGEGAPMESTVVGLGYQSSRWDC